MRNWKEICAKCADGEIEPTFCEYYGEPDGCNSPTRGEHPPVYNAAAMRDALVQCELFLGNVSRHGHPTLNPGDKCTACNGVDELRGMVVRALSAPARNCDMASDWLNDLYVNFKPPCRREMPPEWVDAVMKFCIWLIAPAEKGGEA